MTPFAAFERIAASLAPRTAVVLGSGLEGVPAHVSKRSSIPYSDIPGMVPPSVSGHWGRLAVVEWDGVPALIFLGRLHYYEGHPWEVVTGTVQIAAELGVKQILLTNAAGGIHPSLAPGELMAISGHIKLLGPSSWRALANAAAPLRPYSMRLLDLLQSHERARGRQLLAGVYAALTGPSYETPAEIRALAACGADAVGMSTAIEAEEAARLGMEVAAISCITNRAAGLSDGLLSHPEVLANAKLAVERMRELLRTLIHTQPRSE